MEKIFASLVFLLAFCAIAYSQSDECALDPSKCLQWVNEPPIEPVKWGTSSDKGGYVEQLTVRVLDEYGRAVPGASVSVNWQITRARGSATTKILQTGTNGRVEFTLQNNEFDPKDTNKTYVVKVEYGRTTVVKSFEAINGIVERTVEIPVYNAVFLVRDKNYRGIEGVGISVDGKYRTTTSKNGIAHLILDKGSHVAVPDYGEVEQEIKFELKEDTQINITIAHYDLAVRVTDDNGQPLEAQVHVGTQTKKSSQGGWANFTNITREDVVVEATYGRYRKSVATNLARSENVAVVFDINPPKIDEVNVQYREGSLQIRAVVNDVGRYASGFGNENASIQIFYIGEDNMQKALPMYSIGYNLYEGLVPAKDGQGVIRYTIQATDADGNSATNSDTYVVQTSAPTGFGEPAPPPRIGQEQTGFNWALVPIIAIVGIAMAVAAYWYYKSRKEVEQEKELQAQRNKKEYTYEERALDSIPKKEKPPEPPKVSG